MTLVVVTPGTGSFHCGTCLRDDDLARGLAAAGRDVLTVSLYLPRVTDHERTGPAGACGVPAEAPIFFGGVNVYLQQRSALFRAAPPWLDRALDAAPVLAAAARRAGATEPAELGELTVSMLRGEAGHQRKELERLVRYLRALPEPPRAVLLSNALLLGLAPRLREALAVPVLASLQGEDGFLDELPEPHRTEAWSELAGRARHLDAFVAVSRHHAGVMSERLRLPPGRVRVVLNGIDPGGYRPADAAPVPPAVGFLARLCADKGLGALVDAYLELRRRPGLEAVRLHVAGALTPADEAYVAAIRERVRREGAEGQLDLRPNLGRADKQAFLRTLSVLCVPSSERESFGLYLLEAWASAVPVVQPRHAAFPELVADTGGGILVDDAGPAALADGLASVLADPARRRRLGEAGRAAVLDRFTHERMAAEVLAIVDDLTGACTRTHAGPHAGPGAAGGGPGTAP